MSRNHSGPPPPRQLTANETFESLTHWRTTFTTFYNGDDDDIYKIFLKKDTNWDHSKANYGLNDEQEARARCKSKRKASELSKNLEDLLNTLASYLPNSNLTDKLLKSTKNWQDVWKIVHDHYNVQVTSETLLERLLQHAKQNLAPNLHSLFSLLGLGAIIIAFCAIIIAFGANFGFEGQQENVAMFLESMFPDTTAIERFAGTVDVSGETKVDKKIEGVGMMSFEGFDEKQACDVYEKLDPSKYDEVIDAIGENLGLDMKRIKKMKLAAFSGESISALTGYSHGREGNYIFGQFQVKKRKSGELDLLIAVHKFDWKLETDRAALAEEVRYYEKYKEIKEAHAGTGGGWYWQGTAEVAETLEKFKEFSSKNEAKLTATERDYWVDYFQNLAEKALKDKCPNKSVLNIVQTQG